MEQHSTGWITAAVAADGQVSVTLGNEGITRADVVKSLRAMADLVEAGALID